MLSSFLLSLFVVFFLTCVKSSSSSSSIIVTDHYIAFLDNKKTWSQASDYCSTVYGSNLAIIQNSEENDEIDYIHSFTDTNTWLGGTDSGSEGTWKWVDGSSFSFTDWVVGQPSGGSGLGEQDCMNYHFGGWNDGFCSNEYPFVCDKSLVVT